MVYLRQEWAIFLIFEQYLITMSITSVCVYVCVCVCVTNDWYRIILSIRNVWPAMLAFDLVGKNQLTRGFQGHQTTSSGWHVNLGQKRG